MELEQGTSSTADREQPASPTDDDLEEMDFAPEEYVVFHSFFFIIVLKLRGASNE